jgi:tRNA-dihydrouridine synthase
LHLDLHDKYSDLGLRSYNALRRFFKIYVKGFRGASALRNELMTTGSTAEAHAMLDDFETKFLDEQ